MFTVCDVACGTGEILVKNCTCALINICLRDMPCEDGQTCVLGSLPTEFTCLPQAAGNTNLHVIFEFSMHV